VKITRKERKIILRHLKNWNKEEGLPKGFEPINGVTMIRYGYMQRKMISTEKIEQVAKEIGVKYW